MAEMITQPRMDQKTKKLLLCHEMGHLLGGPPLKSRGGRPSTERQADYFKGQSCARKMLLDEGSFFSALKNLTAIYADEKTNYGYSSVQCRLDTILAGWN